MATYLIDIDDTILRHGTAEPLPGAVDMLNGLIDTGHRIVLVTRCGEEFPEGVYSKEGCVQRLIASGILYDDIVFDCPSPRVVVNDEPCGAIRVAPGGLAELGDLAGFEPNTDNC